MDIELLNRAMRAEARSLGLCDEWYGQWADDADIDELLNKYVKGIDFVITKRFPDNNILLKYAGQEALQRHGIFISCPVDGKAADSPSPVICQGTATGSLVFGNYSVGSVYLRDHADISIEVRDGARVFVEVYDNARLRITNGSLFRSFVYQHGGRVFTEGDVLVRER